MWLTARIPRINHMCVWIDRQINRYLCVCVSVSLYVCMCVFVRACVMSG